jgi:cytochrome c553
MGGTRRRLGARASRPLLAAALLSAGCVAAAAASLQEQIALCVTCHGAAGQSRLPAVPHIGGQPRLFVMYQLFYYREGRRKNGEMNAVAKSMSDADLQALSTYVAGLPPPPVVAGPIDEARYRRGAELARARSCASCHNADYSGREQMPRLAGQRESYTVQALQDYRSGARVGTQAAMAEAVRGLDDAAFADLAYFLARVRP